MNNPWPRYAAQLISPSEQKGLAAVRHFDAWYDTLPPLVRRLFWRLPEGLQLAVIDIATRRWQERILQGNKRCMLDNLAELPIPMQMALVSMFIDTAQMANEGMAIERIFSDLLRNDTYQNLYEE